MTISRTFCRIIRGFSKATSHFLAKEKDGSPTLVEYRSKGNRAAVIFIHGFHGDAVKTWDSFLAQLLSDERLNDWDVYSAGYSTGLSIDLPIWTTDPEIRLCAGGLITKLKNSPLDRYRAITLVAHSMGGLVVQRAILDSNELRQRLAHVVLYGTPSAGLLKATLGARFKPQARDMRVGSKFITQLRKEWDALFGEELPFSFTSVAGETDAFVPASSSLDIFPQSQRAVIPGNHLDIVRPDSKDHLSYSLFYKILTGSRGARTAVESARLAVEHKEFALAIELLMPGVDGLDANAIVTLALALESVGRKEEAMQVIEHWNSSSCRSSLDPVGVLAGRLKRRWLVSRQQQDYDRALELYSDGLVRAEESQSHSQAYYHAINVAYLQLAETPFNAPVPEEVINMARRAISYAEKSPKDQWSLATKGEARLMLGDLSLAVDDYIMARRLAKTLRECDSMHIQAVMVAERIFGEEGVNVINDVFERDMTESARRLDPTVTEGDPV